jgi:hypothetical protein
MDLGSIDPRLMQLLERLLVPGTIVGSWVGLSIGVRVGGGWAGLAELARATLPWHRKD